jgi:hypothetical protein
MNRQLPTEKEYYRLDGVGKAKYTVNCFDGVKKHKDGSDFYDIRIFSNKKKLESFIKILKQDGYKER